jgi:CMP-N,N'-diacetyllegionaminic acid synthase
MSSKSSLVYIGLVPARAGSEGLPGKNRLQVFGKSLTELALSGALETPEISHVVLSTDDEVLKALCGGLNIWIHDRPAEAATAQATANDVIRSVGEYLTKSIGIHDCYIVYLQPTSPLRTSEHISQAIKQFRESPSKHLISGVKTQDSPFKTFTLSGKNEVVPLVSAQAMTSNRQSIPTTYKPNGAIYIFRLGDFLASGEIPVAGGAFFEMSQRESLDVDSIDDLRRAELSG